MRKVGASHAAPHMHLAAWPVDSITSLAKLIADFWVVIGLKIGNQ